MRFILSLCLILIVFLGCSDYGTEYLFMPKAVTDRTYYVLGEAITITISNGGNGTIALQTCCWDEVTYYIDLLESGAWVPYRTRDIPCTKGCPTKLVDLSRATPPHREVIGSEIDKAGTYRFRFFFSDYSARPEAKKLVSNTFTVN